MISRSISCVSEEQVALEVATSKTLNPQNLRRWLALQSHIHSSDQVSPNIHKHI
jgi:hypothetical protein